MTIIKIDDDFNDTYELSNEFEWEFCGIYDLLNVREIRMRISYQFLGEEEVTEEKIKKEIDKYLQSLKDEILSETIEVLECNNGIKVKSD